MSEETKTEDSKAPKKPIVAKDTKIVVTDQMPVKGTAHLAMKRTIPVYGTQSNFTGEVVFDALGNPAGVKLPMPPTHPGIAYYWIPASACDGISVRK